MIKRTGIGRLSFAHANCLIIVRKDDEPVLSGEEAEAYLL